MTDSVVEEALKKALSQPKSAEVDGQRVENHSLGDLVKAAKFFASSQAAKARRPFRITKMRAGGGAE